MLAGFVGSIVPGLPGTPIVLLAAIGHRIYFGQQSVDYWVLGALVVLTAASFVLDYLAGMYGARRFGATWRGVLGSVIGGLIGLFFGLPGVLLGPFLGAALFELLGGYEMKKAIHAGIGATVGLLAGTVGKCGICVMMIGAFTVSVVYHSVH